MEEEKLSYTTLAPSLYFLLIGIYLLVRDINLFINLISIIFIIVSWGILTGQKWGLLLGIFICGMIWFGMGYLTPILYPFREGIQTFPLAVFVVYIIDLSCFACLLYEFISRMK